MNSMTYYVFKQYVEHTKELKVKDRKFQKSNAKAAKFFSF